MIKQVLIYYYLISFVIMLIALVVDNKLLTRASGSMLLSPIFVIVFVLMGALVVLFAITMPISLPILVLLGMTDENW